MWLVGIPEYPLFLFFRKMLISKCWRAIFHQPKKTKYKSVKTNGYASKKENNRAFELKLLERAWKIQNLREQISFLLQESFEYRGEKIRSISYVADFVYEQDGETIVEDTKWFLTDVYKIKKKLLLKRYPFIIFRET